jgi:hypothetical protein
LFTSWSPEAGRGHNRENHTYICVLYGKKSFFSRTSIPLRIRVRIDPPHPLVCRKRRLNGAVLQMRLEKPRSRELFLLKKFLVSSLKLLFGFMYRYKVEIACVDVS